METESRYYILPAGLDGPLKMVGSGEWAEYFFEHASDRTVAKTVVGRTVVWTLFLGLGGPFAKPHPYKTVIDDPDGPWHNATRRYRNAQDARRGHDEMVNRVRQSKGLDTPE